MNINSSFGGFITAGSDNAVLNINTTSLNVETMECDGELSGITLKTKNTQPITEYTDGFIYTSSGNKK